MLTDIERDAVYRKAVEQLQMEQALRGFTAEEVAVLKFFRESRCASCNDPDSDPVYDGAGGIVCDLCGDDWKGRLR